MGEFLDRIERMNRMQCKCGIWKLNLHLSCKSCLSYQNSPVFLSSGDSRIFGQDREDEQDEMRIRGKKYFVFCIQSCSSSLSCLKSPVFLSEDSRIFGQDREDEQDAMRFIRICLCIPSVYSEFFPWLNFILYFVYLCIRIFFAYFAVPFVFGCLRVAK